MKGLSCLWPVRAAALAIMVALGAPPGATPARGQVFITATASGGPDSAGQISRTSLDRYAETLGLDEAQRDMARTLHEGYVAAYQDAARERREAIGALTRSADDAEDRSAFRERMPEIMRRFRDRTAELEKSFLDDLRSVLTPEQARAWPRVERMRRRETGLARAGLAGESVDLIEVVRALGLRAEGLAETLDQYEADLDRTIRERAAAMEEFREVRPGDGRPLDAEAMRAMMAKARESGEKIREVNRAYARRIEALLPESARPGFSGEVRRRSFPQVYRTPHTLRLYEAAARFDDLAPAQRQQIEEDRRSYERELAVVNERWADAVLESEKDGQSGAVSADGQLMRFRFGDDPGPLQEARKARRELDERFRDRLLNRLSQDQKDRLPKREEVQAEGGDFVTSEAVIIRHGGG
jgi:Spy/CpxP family protein refolding chaperone